MTKSKDEWQGKLEHLSLILTTNLVN